MGNSNCGCATKKIGGYAGKRGGMSCGKTKKQRRNIKKRRVKRKKRGGGCGCEIMSGGYKYDRRSSVEAVKRLKKRVSKNTRSKSKSRRKKKKKTLTKRNGRK